MLIFCVKILLCKHYFRKRKDLEQDLIRTSSRNMWFTWELLGVLPFFLNFLFGVPIGDVKRWAKINHLCVKRWFSPYENQRFSSKVFDLCPPLCKTIVIFCYILMLNIIFFTLFTTKYLQYDFVSCLSKFSSLVVAFYLAFRSQCLNPDGSAPNDCAISIAAL